MSGPPPPPPGFVMDDGRGIPPPPPGFKLMVNPNMRALRSELRQGREQPWYEGAWASVRQAIFGSPERAELRETGLGLQPTTAEMVKGGLFAASPMIGLPTAGAMQRGAVAAGSRLPGAVGGAVTRAGEFVGAHPRLVDATIGAVGGAAYGGDERAALIGAALGAVTGGRMPGRAPRPPVGGATPARVPAPAAPPAAAPAPKPAPPAAAAPAAAPRTVSPTTDEAVRRYLAGERLPNPSNPGADRLQLGAQRLSNAGRHAEAEALQASARASAAPKVDPGRAAAAAHGDLMAFAKDIAQKNPKIGSKIWILLKDGKPVRMLTSDQAGAVTRAKRPGETATWVRNLWGSPVEAFAGVN